MSSRPMMLVLSSCLNLALLETNKVLPRLLRDFRFALVHPDRELAVHATFFVVQAGLDVFIQKKSMTGHVWSGAAS